MILAHTDWPLDSLALSWSSQGLYTKQDLVMFTTACLLAAFVISSQTLMACGVLNFTWLISAQPSKEQSLAPQLMFASTSSIILHMDHLHGLCKDCVSKCSEIYSYSKNQNECSRCNENPPQVIYDDNGSISVLCTKCYIKEASSPRRKSEYSVKDKNNSIILMSVQQTTPLFHSITKSDVLNKGFFANDGKMIKKIQKYFSKFEGKTEEATKDLSRKSLLTLSALSWEKIVFTCNKLSSLMYVLVSQTHLFGFYHSEPVKISERPSVEDKESGFFLSSKGKLDLQFYKANTQQVAYTSQNRSISLGKPPCLQVLFEGARPKVRCDIFQGKVEEWTEFYVYRL